ncbi:hypothetical protein V2J09_019193 [Rumex salicifolius]
MAGFRTSALFLCLAMSFGLFSMVVEGRDHLVGGKPDAWKIPSSESQTLNKWAEKARFHPGDYLVWKYDPKEDSVLQVTREAYLACNTTNPITEHKDGETRLKLHHSGPFYFISGAEGHCDQGEKMIVVVMSLRNRHLGASPAPSPSPASALDSPAVAPTSAASAASSKAGFIMVGLAFLVGIFAIDWFCKEMVL